MKGISDELTFTKPPGTRRHLNAHGLRERFKAMVSRVQRTS